MASVSYANTTSLRRAALVWRAGLKTQSKVERTMETLYGNLCSAFSAGTQTGLPVCGFGRPLLVDLSPSLTSCVYQASLIFLTYPG